MLRPQSSSDEAELSGHEAMVGAARAVTAPGTGWALPEPQTAAAWSGSRRRQQDSGLGCRLVAAMVFCLSLWFPFSSQRSHTAEASGCNKGRHFPCAWVQLPPRLLRHSTGREATAAHVSAEPAPIIPTARRKTATSLFSFHFYLNTEWCGF